MILDFGAVIDGYHSDMTRTFAIGDVDQDLLGIIQAVTDAQNIGCDKVEPGSKGIRILMMPVDRISQCRTFLNTLFMGQDMA